MHLGGEGRRDPCVGVALQLPHPVLVEHDGPLEVRQEPKGRFLIYKNGPEPPMSENWLLDVQLASGHIRNCVAVTINSKHVA